ncbi:MAG: hypothetical protein SOZ51_09560 [Eubacteriales bacterium]|nr:hypothetical protein [Eubacteriales bacterium]
MRRMSDYTATSYWFGCGQTELKGWEGTDGKWIGTFKDGKALFRNNIVGKVRLLRDVEDWDKPDKPLPRFFWRGRGCGFTFTFVTVRIGVYCADEGRRIVGKDSVGIKAVP